MVNKKDFDSFIKKGATELERKYMHKQTASSSDIITHYKTTTQMRTREIFAKQPKGFEQELISYIETENASECILKGSLSDYITAPVRNSWFQEDAKKQRTRMLEEKEKIKQICAKYNLNCSFNDCSKSGKHMGFDCLIVSTQYSVFLYDADIKRLKTLFLNNRIEKKNSKTKEIQEYLERNACGSKAIESFKNSSLFLHISKEINDNISKRIVSNDKIKYFYVSIVVYANAIKIGLSCTNPAMLIFEKLYRFEKLGYKNIENRNQENTIYCAFIEYYKKFLNCQSVLFDKLDYSSGLEEYGNGNPSVLIYFNVKRSQNQELKDLF